MTKESLKDKLEGNELDLSLSNLTKVPVKELAALTKATSLDLSCNQLTILPDSFTSLIHLVKIDLSKNALKELPSNFGRLEKLQHLDLLGNQLQMLPVSFARLNNLKWLDLKENPPLEPMLKKNVGDCLDDKQCRLCAKRVIFHMRAIQADQDRIRQKKLEQEKVQEAARIEEEARQRLIKKQQKQMDKERRRKEYEVAQAAKRQQDMMNHGAEEEEKDETEVRTNGVGAHVREPSGGMSCMSVFLMLLVLLVAVCVGVYFFCESDKNNALCQDIYEVVGQAQQHIHRAWDQLHQTIHNGLDQIQQQISQLQQK